MLDANALIGFFEDREVAARRIERLVGETLRQSSPLLMSAVNWGEVFYTAWRRHGEATAREAEERLLELPIAVIEVRPGTVLSGRCPEAETQSRLR